MFQSRGPSEGYSYPVCTTCGRRHPRECRRAAGTCFKCGQAGHLQKDCKKNTTTSTFGQADKKPGASGRVFAITEGHAANTSAIQIGVGVLVDGCDGVKASMATMPVVVLVGHDDGSSSGVVMVEVASVGGVSARRPVVSRLWWQQVVSEGGGVGMFRWWCRRRRGVSGFSRWRGDIFGVRRKTFPTAAGGGWPEMVVATGGGVVVTGGSRWLADGCWWGKRRPDALIILFVPISLAMGKDDILEQIHVLSHYGHRISAHYEIFKETINSKATMITPIKSKHILPHEAR
uniref:CCHC-type domain-containing protein n=1 Tax=Tanacetum cinerariifolium TaxID=118510 RepID=A0A6L2J743_TANCI|nr:hypothetical protein [Tanacetum cinerariifolium]